MKSRKRRIPELSVLRLDEHQLAQVYPLIRAAAQVGRNRWEAFGRELIASGGGILAVEAPDKCFHGAAAFRQLRTLRHQLSLHVEILVAFELRRQAPVREALRFALEEIAREMGCQSIVFTMAAPTHAQPFSARRMNWERLGLQMETVSFVQQLGAG